ncbi:MAG: MFS transporter [Candidatus Thermoplasmatota archaeon]|nr:MFS transporter [Candidatus Thermoplasmatota archaeon]
MKAIPIIAMSRGLRSFYLGYTSFLVPLFLYHNHFSYIDVGIYSLAATVFSSIYVLVSGFLGDLYSKKFSLILMSGLPAVAFIIFLTSSNFYILFATSIFGLSFSAVGGGAGGGPVAPVMNALVADNVTINRTGIYSKLTIISILGAVLGGGTSTFLENVTKLYFTYLFLIAVILTAVSIIFMFYIKEERRKPEKEEKKEILPMKSGRDILMVSFAGLMGSLGLGVVTPLMSLYFKARGIQVSEISDIFTISYIVSGIGIIFSPFFERILGSVNAITVFRTLGSALFVVIPFVSPFLAGALYIARTGIYQMALPIRQSFQMTIFDSSERARGGSLAGISRRLPYGISTTIGGYLMSIGAYVVMFSFAGIVSLFDPILYYLFFSKREKSLKSKDETL